VRHVRGHERCTAFQALPCIALQAVTAIEAWQAQVTICVITNRADLLQNVIDKWALEGLQICHYTRPLDEGQQYALLWAHREVFERAARQGASRTDPS